MRQSFDRDFSLEHLFHHLNTSDHNASTDGGGLTGGLAGGAGTLLVVAGLVDRYVAPVVIIVGLLSNLVALFVFSERSMLRRSSNVYLAAISARLPGSRPRCFYLAAYR